MEHHDKESFYPSHFRDEDVSSLAGNIKLHQSVELIGMKRVGINNFLRYFLIKKSNHLDKKYLIIMVDLNNLFEREVFAFWRLTLKRIIDVVKNSSLPTVVKEKITHSFDVAIQTNDPLITFDEIREVISLIINNNLYPVFIFNRFDRLKNVVSIEFYDNLTALKDAGHNKLSFIFTSYREMEKLFPNVFFYTTSSGFAQIRYIKPVSLADGRIVTAQIEKQYDLNMNDGERTKLLVLTGGHIQYLRLSLLSLHEYLKENNNKLSQKFFTQLETDERIMLQSEELWESLTPLEQEVMRKIVFRERLNHIDKGNISYLIETGFIHKDKRRWHLFSPLFFNYVVKRTKMKTMGNVSEFTKQEQKAYSYLMDNLNKICERDQIINTVWPESSEWGASDWSLDKLIARVRIKLRNQKSLFQIITIRTRGYKLIETGSPTLISGNVS